MFKIKNKKANKETNLLQDSLGSQQAGHFYKLGMEFHGKGIIDQAVSCYNQVLKFDPKHDMALYSLGIAMQEKECLDEYQVLPAYSRQYPIS